MLALLLASLLFLLLLLLLLLPRLLLCLLLPPLRRLFRLLALGSLRTFLRSGKLAHQLLLLSTQTARRGVNGFYLWRRLLLRLHPCTPLVEVELQEAEVCLLIGIHKAKGLQGDPVLVHVGEAFLLV